MKRCACSQPWGCTHAIGCPLHGEVREGNFIEPGSADDPWRETRSPHTEKPRFGPVQQSWVLEIPFMQQSVLFAAVRAPDGLRKDHPVKVLLRWYRRCVLLSAFDKRVLPNPFEPGGGSFTGPFERHHAEAITGRSIHPADWHTLSAAIFNDMRSVYLRHVDEMPHHFQLHFMHAAQIVGVHHDDAYIRAWWWEFYLMIVNDAHLHPEMPEEMNLRLSDNDAEWRAREEVTAK